mgnify:CR=1 FL=1
MASRHFLDCLLSGLDSLFKTTKTMHFLGDRPEGPIAGGLWGGGASPTGSYCLPLDPPPRVPLAPPGPYVEVCWIRCAELETSALYKRKKYINKLSLLHQELSNSIDERSNSLSLIVHFIGSSVNQIYIFFIMIFLKFDYDILIIFYILFVIKYKTM